MRMKSLVLIIIALGCGLVASIGISQVMDRGGSSSDNLEMDQILVALNDIDIGAKLDATNVKLEDWPRNKIPEGAIRRLDQVTEKYANARFYKGEALHVSKITATPGNVAIQIPEGYRAMPVKVEEDTVMKAISPGDRVDVMVYLKSNGRDVRITGVFTILKNVRVFAVNTNTERTTDEKGSGNFRTVSLLVKPDHARELVLAARSGKIVLSLRHPDEPNEVAGTEDVTPIDQLLSGQGKVVSDPANNNPAPLLSHLRGSEDDAWGISGSRWTMQVMGPGNVSQYDWPDLGQLPVQSRPSGAPKAPSTENPPPATPPTEGGADGEWHDDAPGDEPKPAALRWLD